MHRVYNRCTQPEDISHHIGFLKNVLRHRSQDMTWVKDKIEGLHAKRRRRATSSTSSPDHKSTLRSDHKSDHVSVTSVTFDAVSKVHQFTRQCLIESFKKASFDDPRVVYSSLPKLGSRISTKRSILGTVKSVIKY